MSFSAELINQNPSEEVESRRATISPSGPASTLAGQIANLRARIEQVLAATGVVLTRPLDLVPDGRGGIAVAGWHPQRLAIEAALSHDYLLERDFTEMARQFESVHGVGDGGAAAFVLTIQPTAAGGALATVVQRAAATVGR